MVVIGTLVVSIVCLVDIEGAVCDCFTTAVVVVVVVVAAAVFVVILFLDGMIVAKLGV